MAIPFVQASHYTNANRGRGDIKFIVIHDMEMAEKATTAEACAAYFARATTKASSHYTVDCDSIVQCVRDEDVAWCAPGANSTGLHFEHAGFASQDRGDWLDPFGRAMLARSAALVAAKCRQYGIAVRKGDYADIRAGRPCIVGHWDVTKAFPDKGSHTDPGANFPWDYYIGLVQAAYDGTPLAAKDWFDMATQADLKAVLLDPDVLKEIARFVWTGYGFGPDADKKVGAGWLTQQDALQRLAIKAASDDLTGDQLATAVAEALAAGTRVEGELKVVPKTGV